MKKIFAIALALVMVLSMASAFASTWCRTDFNWDCATTTCENGTGSVELIPYVKGNDCGKGNLFTVSKCAGAVNGDNIYFAIKLTVDANPSEEWWNVAKLDFSTMKGIKNMKAGTQTFSFLPMNNGQLVTMIKAANSGDFKAGEYYLLRDDAGTDGWKLVKAANFDADKTTLFSATVENASKAKVCVKLASENKFTSSKIGDYTIEMINGRLHITKKDYSAVVAFDGDDKVTSISVAHKINGAWEAEAARKKYVADNGSAFVSTVPDYAGYACNDGAFLKGVLDTFKFTFGTCMTKKAINANFGWDNSSESCFQWNKDVLAVVNSECQVAIPKTGDVSVVAYAVMALVAAAGAMGLKK